jgi:hypothetical protein
LRNKDPFLRRRRDELEVVAVLIKIQLLVG